MTLLVAVLIGAVLSAEVKLSSLSRLLFLYSALHNLKVTKEKETLLKCTKELWWICGGFVPKS